MPSFVASFSREQIVAAVRVADFYKGLGGGGGGAVSNITASTGKALVAQDILGATPLASLLGANAIDIAPTRAASTGARGDRDIVIGNGSGIKTAKAGNDNVIVGNNVMFEGGGETVGQNILIGRDLVVNKNGGTYANQGKNIVIGNSLGGVVKGLASSNIAIGEITGLAPSFSANGSSFAGSTFIGSGFVTGFTARTDVVLDTLCFIGSANQVNCREPQLSGAIGISCFFGSANTEDFNSSLLIGHSLSTPALGGFGSEYANFDSITRVGSGASGTQAVIDFVSGADSASSLIRIGPGGVPASFKGAIALESMSIMALPATGTQTIPDGTSMYVAQANLAIKLPSAPAHGQLLTVVFNVAFSSAFSANTGHTLVNAPSGSFTAGSSVEFVFNKSDFQGTTNAWFRVR